MKILAIITGIGYGDSLREAVILDEFVKRGVVNGKEEIVVAGYDNSYEYFNKKYRLIRIHSYKFPGYNLRFQVLSFIFLNLLLPFFWIYDMLNLLKTLKRMKFVPDLIISDFEPVGIFLACLLGKKCSLVFGFDLKTLQEFMEQNKLNLKQRLQALYIKLMYGSRYVDFVVISSLIGRKSDYGKYRYVNPIMKQLGGMGKKELMKKLRLKKEPVLLMLGGSEFGINLANRMLTFIEGIDEEFIIFGHSSSFSRGNVRSYVFKENFLEYLQVAKGVITLAGYNTLVECIAFKKPMLLFPIKDHIEQELNYFQVRGMAMRGNKDDLEGSLEGFLRRIPELQKKMDILGIKTNGAKGVVDILAGAYKTL